MNITYYKDLFNYTQWANAVNIDMCNQLTDEQWLAPIVSSFPTIKDTVIHIIGAEKVWLERVKDVKNIVWLPNEFNGSKADALALWSTTTALWNEYLENFDSGKINEVITFKRLNGEVNSLTYGEICTHVCNHSTYHRGQLITLFRQVGFTDVKSTDYILHCLKKQKL